MDLLASFEMLLWILLIIFFLVMIIFTIQGGPYVPTDEETVREMIKEAGNLKGKKVADLGSGDGRIVIMAAKAGAMAHGYEINPRLVYRSKRRIKREKLAGNAHIHLQNMWNVDYSDFDIIFLYQIKHTMPWFGRKLKRELPKGAIVISNYFTFPNWKPVKTGKRIRVYKV